MSKLNIFKPEWIEMIFEGRNKAYGAYQLRAENPKTTTKSLFIGASLFALAVSSPIIAKYLSEELSKNEEEKVTLAEMAALPPPPKEDLPPPPPPEAPKSVNDQVKFPPPKVVKKELVRDEDPPTIEDLKTADPGQKNEKGDKDAGEIVVVDPPGDGDKGNQIIEEDPNKVYVAVEVQAEYPGGIGSFNKSFVNKFRAPEVDEGVTVIKMLIGFVVEKDGSLTSIRVLRDGGLPTAGKEAIRVLNSMPKWKPAIQNGRSVRSQFTLPITVQVGE